MSSKLLAKEDQLVPPPPAKLPMGRSCCTIELFRDRECVCVCVADVQVSDTKPLQKPHHIKQGVEFRKAAFEVVDISVRDGERKYDTKAGECVLLPGLASEQLHPARRKLYGNERSTQCLAMAKATFACILWAVCSTCSIFLTPYVLNTLAFNYPITLAAMTQCVSAAFILVATKLIQPRSISVSEFGLVIVPMSLLAAIGFILSHAVYMMLSVAFVQMLKAASPITVMIVMTLFNILTPTKLLCCAVVIISVGCVVAGFGETAFSLLGVMLFVVLDISNAIQDVWTQKLLLTTYGIKDLMYYITPTSGIWLVALASIEEIPRLTHTGDVSKLLNNPWPCIAYMFSGIIVYLTLLIAIQQTSALTLKVVAQIRNVAIICGGVFLFGETVNGLQIGGYTIELVGFWVFHVAMQRIHKRDNELRIKNGLKGRDAKATADATMSIHSLERFHHCS